MYNLIVGTRFRDWDGGTFRFEKGRFLEYTREAIQEQLGAVSAEAIECLKSWPCALLDEGRAQEVVHIARILDIRDLGKEIAVTVERLASKTPILNADLWRIREDLDIEQFEFSRTHWAVKERDLLSALRATGHELKPSVVRSFEEKPLPAPPRAALIRARSILSEWSHTELDDLLLESGVENLSAERALGSRRDRANAIIQFAIDNPGAVTAERSLFSAYLAARCVDQRGDTPTTTALGVVEAMPTSASNDRSPNRVFIVHGQNESARNSVVTFLERLGLIGIVLHEQPNMGRHLLTKFIEEADLVTFAIVLMTDDDVGSLRGGTLAPRARQNVILELGYFLAHLGQARVCALITPGLETPSDFDGIVYIRMDAEGLWQNQLRRELLAAKMPIAD